MSTAILDARLQADGSALLELKGAAKGSANIPKAGLDSFAEAGKRVSRPSPRQAAEAPSVSIDGLGFIERAIRQWSLQDTSEAVLCVRTPDQALSDLPWEILPMGIGLPQIAVARLPSGQPARTPTKTTESPPNAVTIVGWSKAYLPGLPTLPGIEREVSGLARLLDPHPSIRSAQVLSEPTQPQFLASLKASKPGILHMSLSYVQNREGEATLLLPDKGEYGRTASVNDLASGILRRSRPWLVVLNACSTGFNAARVLTERLGCISFGWAGDIDDELATDFAFFFYQRLLERLTPLQAVRAFTTRDSLARSRQSEPIPMLWLPTIQAVHASLPQPLVFRQPAETSSGRSRPKESSPPGPKEEVKEPSATPPQEVTRSEGDPLAGSIQIEFMPVAALNPALLKNGRPAIERLTLVSSGKVGNVRLEIQCDTGSGCSIVRQTLSLEQGSHPVVTQGVHFPVLYQLMTEQIGRRYVNFVVTAYLGDSVVAETTQAVLWMGAQEWMDRKETWPFIPAFVQCESDAVKEILVAGQRVLRILGGPKAAFDGYQRMYDDAKAVDRQMEAIFLTLWDDPYELTYANPPSSPVYVHGPDPMGQRVRFPDEVMQHKRGTCHDLSLLFASCAEHIGVFPLVVLIRNHTFCGYWTSDEKHEEYWKERSMGLRTTSFGSNWMISQRDELNTLLSNGSVVLLDAVVVGERTGTFEVARDQGKQRLVSCDAIDFDAAIDVCASRYAVQPV